MGFQYQNEIINIKILNFKNKIKYIKKIININKFKYDFS